MTLAAYLVRIETHLTGPGASSGCGDQPQRRRLTVSTIASMPTAWLTCPARRSQPPFRRGWQSLARTVRWWGNWHERLAPAIGRWSMPLVSGYPLT